MGVKDLWNIIAPLAERKPLNELHGKAVAIDLSGWVVDSQTVTDNTAQRKMYLRNLFFRTAFMLQHGIFPVFILEGKAPELKKKTMAKRNEIRRGTPAKEPKDSKKSRSQFNAVLKQCKELLMYMGLFCLQGEGEAEAMCAYLDQDGFVDGCISQDSDCFLYGAKKVYRNFCTTSQGSIDVYSMEKIEQVLNIGRNKMIALALLCGCDYDDGVNGIGKEAALKLFKTVKDEEIIDRLRSWTTDYRKFERKEKELSDPNICSVCGHEGKMRSHLKLGCVDCRTTVKCKDTFKEQRALIKNELTMRKRALAVDNFPNQDIINEFLICKERRLSSLPLKWEQPQVRKFIDFVVHHLCWEPEYAFTKIFPLITQWQLQNLPSLSVREHQTLHLLVPKKIRKIRRKRGILCYEVVWKDNDRYLDGLILVNTSDEENDEEGVQFGNDLVSIEAQTKFMECYPEMAQEFEESRKPKKKTAARKRKVKPVEKNRKIDEFILKDQMQLLQKSMENISISPNITPKRKKKPEKKGKNVGLKKNPQINRVLETERLDAILNGSLDRMFNEIGPEDFETDGEADMSEIIGRLCGISGGDSYKRCNVDENDFVGEDMFAENKIDEENDMIDAIDRMCGFGNDNNGVIDGNDDCIMSERVNGIFERIGGNENEGRCEKVVDVEEDDMMSLTIDKICGVDAEVNDLNEVSVNNVGAKMFQKEEVIDAIDLTQDEFEIDEVYVPLADRLKAANRRKAFSLGIDSLLNSTNESCDL